MKLIVIVRFLVFTALIGTSTLNVFGQSAANEVVVTGNIGFSVFGAVLKGGLKLAERKDIDTTKQQNISNVDVSSKRVRILAVDLGLSDMWSVGLLYSNQQFNGSFDYQYKNRQDVIIQEQVSLTNTRSSIAFFPKIHYPINHDRFDLYSGARLGFVFNGLKVNTTDPNFDILNKFVLSRPIVAVTPIGVRGYFTKNIGCNLELNIGTPNIIGFGLNVRLNN